MQPSRSLLFQTALRCRKLGISTVSVGDQKFPVAEWKQFQEAIPTDEEIAAQYSHYNARGIAVVCGPVSGNLEVIDVDCKNDLDGNLMRRFYQMIQRAMPALAASLVIARTRSGGYHLFYRCPVTERNQPLAKRPSTEAELHENPRRKFRVLIETRAKGGIACIAPTEGYYFIRGDLSMIPHITPSQRNLILAAARSLNQIKEEENKKEVIKRRHLSRRVNPDYALDPFDDYNQRGDVIGLLQKHGWKKLDSRKPGKTEFLRPGFTDKHSSGNFNHAMNLFSVFTTSTDFEPETGYKPADVFIMLECNNNESEGERKLLELGYGVLHTGQKKGL